MLRRLRERTGLNQKDFAASVGMKQTTYNGYETGKHRPSHDVLIAIANKYSVSVDYLLGVSEETGKAEVGHDLPRTRMIICAHETPGAFDAIMELMYELGKMLQPENQKFRVTIDYDPQMSAFEVRREEIN